MQAESSQKEGELASLRGRSQELHDRLEGTGRALAQAEQERQAMASRAATESARAQVLARERDEARQVRGVRGGGPAVVDVTSKKQLFVVSWNADPLVAHVHWFL